MYKNIVKIGFTKPNRYVCRGLLAGVRVQGLGVRPSGRGPPRAVGGLLLPNTARDAPGGLRLRNAGRLPNHRRQGPALQPTGEGASQ